MQWDQQQGGLLHVLSEGGRVYEGCRLLQELCVSDRGTAVLVDGRHLRITPLRWVRGKGSRGRG